MVAVIQQYPRESKVTGKTQSQKYAVSVPKVLEALRWLIANHPGYAGLKLPETLEQELNAVVERHTDNDNEEKRKDMIIQEVGLLCLDEDQELVLLPPIASEPVNVKEGLKETLAYPHLYPHGKCHASDPDRPEKLTEREYVQLRLSHDCSSFAKDAGWTFDMLNQMLKTTSFITR